MAEDTPAPIATPEEVGLAVEKLTAAAESRPGFAVVLAGAASIRTVLAALASSNAEIERVTLALDVSRAEAAELRRMLGTEPDWKQRAYGERLKVAALTDQVGRLREALTGACEQVLDSYRTWVADDIGAHPRPGQIPRYDEARAALSQTEPEK